MSIKCFSVDHRDTKNWKFSWIRLGTGFNTPSVIKDTIGESICTERFNVFLGEYTAMWWIWKHLGDFGKTDYVGLTQYRRYFTGLKPNLGRFPIVRMSIADDQDSSQVVLSPDQLQAIMVEYHLDGIVPARFVDFDAEKNRCKNVIDLLYHTSDPGAGTHSLGLTYEMCEKIFQFLEQALPGVSSTYKTLNTIHFNMFVLTRSLFEKYSEIVSQVVFNSINWLDEIKAPSLNPRLFGYVIERLSSCIFLKWIEEGKKFIELPICLLDKVEMKS